MEEIKVGIVGATGYTGSVLTQLLYRHPFAKLVSLTSRSNVGASFASIYNNFEQISDIVCEAQDIEVLSEKADVIFIALPHGIASFLITEEIIQNTKIIDLGADFRIENVDTYEQWYNVEHKSKNLLEQAVYGLCELHRKDIENATILANPGCYTTCSILTLAPLVKNNLIETETIVVDAKSGVTGAGRSTNLGSLYCECNESIKAYKLASHRHTPEIEQELSKLAGKDIKITFTPHLTPMNRGILSTVYATLKDNVSQEMIKEAYKEMYQDEHFVRLLQDNVFPETRWVKGSNFVDINFKIDTRTNRIIALGAIDNLMKGASSQAIQNMNIMFKLDEKLGIDMIPSFPI